jgi:predicted nucleic acid-binding protein
VIVVDASIVVTALADDAEDGERVRARLLGEVLTAPELLDVEVVSAWRRLASAGALSHGRVERAVADLRALPVRRVGHRPLLHRCWQLRANLTTYDAVYVALAEALDVPLLTADARIEAAPGIRCAVELLA